jgi:hypothetical protein
MKKFNKSVLPEQYLYLSLIFFLITNLTFCQSDILKPNFGIKLTNNIVELPNKYNYLIDVQLQILPKSKSKKFYNHNNEEYSFNDFKCVPLVKVTWNKKEGDTNKYKLVIPPLKPNRFYRLKSIFYSSESVVAMFLMMHDEKNTNWFSSKKEWMKLLNRISDKNIVKKDGENLHFPITYDPKAEELRDFKKRIKDVNLADLDITEANYIKGIVDKDEIKLKKSELKQKKENIILILESNAKLTFKVLNFIENQNKYSKNDFIMFCKWIQDNKTNFLNEDDLIYFSSNLLEAPDYINIYNFYEKYLLGLLNNKSIKKGELKEVIETAIKTEVNTYDSPELLPNYLGNFKVAVLENTTPISTHTSSFETAYKLTLVPDFGYVAYVNNNDNTPKGGSLFLGVNVSLSPTNKNVPLKISKLSLMQRLSIHTGLTIGSIYKENVRDNFFENYSLLLGGSYKVLTQGTRINFGGLFYNKIDAINGSKSIAIQPYIGLSIDIEIKKWLQTFYPKQ